MEMLKGKVALVAGGTLGIGQAAVLAFAREGASVVFAGRRIEPGEELAQKIIEAGGQALFVQADVTRADQVERLVNVAVEKFGRLDCALNNAAMFPKYAFTADINEEDFDYELAYDLKVSGCA